MDRPEYIVIHDSLTPDRLLPDWEAIKRYHVKEKGYQDISYHWGIEDVNGVTVLQVGRPTTMQGAHCKEYGMNRRSFGICVVGNFDLAPPPLRTLHYLRDFVWALMVNHGIPVQKVIGHREAGLMAGFDWRKGQYKSCPGKLFPLSGLRNLLTGRASPFD